MQFEIYKWHRIKTANAIKTNPIHNYVENVTKTQDELDQPVLYYSTTMDCDYEWNELKSLSIVLAIEIWNKHNMDQTESTHQN